MSEKNRTANAGPTQLGGKGQFISDLYPVAAEVSQQTGMSKELILAQQWERRWGAIATDGPRGAMGVVTDKRSEREASKTTNYARLPRKGGVDCKVDAAYDNQCAAVVVGDGGYNVSSRPTADQAIATGMKTCRDAGRTNCHPYYTACSLPARIRSYFNSNTRPHYFEGFMGIFNSIHFRFLILTSMMNFGAIASAKPISFDAPNEIIGRIIGPITSGQTEDDTQIKAYHIKINRPIFLDAAGSSCGIQRIKSLPILSAGLGKYKNKKVKISASIQCIESKLGTYAIDHIYSVNSIN